MSKGAGKRLLQVLVEGDLEKRVLESFLQPYYHERFVMEITQYSGNGDLKINFIVDAQRTLDAESDALVLCLVDLYEEPFDIYQKSAMTPAEGFEKVQAHMYNLIDARYHARFGAFPVVMELETWLLADSKVIREKGLAPIVAPETILHPASHLKQHLPSYSKLSSGIDLFNRASAKRVYEDNCPHFKQMIDWLIQPQPVKSATKNNPAYEAWGAEYKRLLKIYDDLEDNISTDEDLERAIQAQRALDAHLNYQAKHKE